MRDPIQLFYHRLERGTISKSQYLYWPFDQYRSTPSGLLIRAEPELYADVHLPKMW